MKCLLVSDLHYTLKQFDWVSSWAGKQHFGDTALSQWIHRYSPDIVLAGHIHQSPFRQGGSWVDQVGSTWVFNP